MTRGWCLFTASAILALVFHSATSLYPYDEGYRRDISDQQISELKTDSLAYLTQLLENHIRRFNYFQGELFSDVNNIKSQLKKMSVNLQSLERESQPQLAKDELSKSIINDLFYKTEGLLKDMDSKMTGGQKNVGNRLNSIQNTVIANAKEVNSKVSMLVGSHTCGGSNGWRRVGVLNMTNVTSTCPSVWKVKEYSGKRMCGRSSPSLSSCNSVYFPVPDMMYSSVCGRIVGYQYGGTVGFLSSHEKYVRSIDEAYVDGVSITYSQPRKHIWTLAAGGTESNPDWATSCPCDASVDIDVPDYVGSDYFCESGNNGKWNGIYKHYINDPLWDGEECSRDSQCCSFNNPPYFVKNLIVPTDERIEVRLCGYTSPNYADVLIGFIELYVK